MKTKISITLFAISFVILFSIFASSTYAYTVSGKVTGSGIGPLNNTNIDAYNFTNKVLINSTVTNSTGDYSLNLPDVTTAYTFNVSAIGFVTSSQTTLVNSNKTLNFILGPEASVTLSGYVKDTSNNPISSVTVKARANGQTVATSTTDITGFYSMGIWNNTNYDVSASKINYYTAVQTIFITGNTGLNFTLSQAPSTGTFYGYVYNGSISNLLNGATIAFKQSGATLYTTTTVNGYYTVNVSQGTYNITASLSGYYDSTQTGPVSLGQQVQIDFNMSSIPPTQPGQPGPPGGNGGPPGEEKIDYSRIGAGRCDPEWQCSEWSSCVNEIQTRTCIDTEECGSDEDKPAEKRSCTVPVSVQETTEGVPKITGLAFLIDFLKKGSVQTAILVGIVVILIVAVSYLYLRKGFEKRIKKKG